MRRQKMGQMSGSSRLPDLVTQKHHAIAKAPVFQKLWLQAVQESAQIAAAVTGNITFTNQLIAPEQ